MEYIQHKNKWTTDTYYNMGKPWEPYAQLKKPVIADDSTHMKF